jgi:hypothetical protein
MTLSGDRKLWLCVGLAFGLLFAAWTILFTLAGRNRVAAVPLETSGNTHASHVGSITSPNSSTAPAHTPAAPR